MGTVRGRPKGTPEVAGVGHHGMLLLALNACIMVVLMRPLLEDLANMATGGPLEGAAAGWKKVHGDVFRLPHGSALLFALLAGGVHLLAFSSACVCMAVAGMVLPCCLSECSDGYPCILS